MVEPSNLQLTNGQATVKVIGQLFYNDSQHQYQCVVSGVTFNAILIDSQTLECNLQFNSNNMPGGSSSKGNYLYVETGSVRSNALSVYYTTPPQITSVQLAKKNTRLILTGANLSRGSFCVFSWGNISPVSPNPSGNEGSCEMKGRPSSGNFQVQINSFGQMSNWVTIP